MEFIERTISIRRHPDAIPGLIELMKYVGVTESVIEIGSYAGDSTEVFAQMVSKVYSIDPWENGYDDNDGSSWRIPMRKVEDQFDEVSRTYRNIHKLKMPSQRALSYFPDGRYPMVYIDALHTYEGVKSDIEVWKPKVVKGGWICGHDFQNKFPGVKKAVIEMLGTPERVFKDTSWAVQVR